MQDNVSELRFFVTTQKDHSRKALSWTQISDVRSHCAIRQHASRRAKQGLPISPKRKRKSRTIIQNVLCTGEQLFPYEPTTQALVPTTPVLPDSATIACQELCEAKLWHGLDDIFPLSIPPDEPVVTNLSPIPEPTSSVSSSASPRESNGQHQDVPKKPWMQPPPIFQIFSTLDPFIRLPVEVTDEDKRALQFYLESGRRLLLGTSKNPKCCPAVDIARSLMQTCPVFVLSHAVIGNLVQSRMMQRSSSPYFFSRCARMYKAANVLISDPDVPLHRKVWALIQMSWTEFVAQRSDLQSLHTNALDDILEARGGLAVLADDPFNLNIRFFAGQLVRSDTPVPALHLLESSKDRFLLCLRRIQCWVTSLYVRPFCANSVSIQPIDFQARLTCRRSLSPLISYLNNLIDKCLPISSKQSQTWFQDNSGAYFCIVNLIMTLVEYDLSPTDTFEYLHRIQECMQESVAGSARFSGELNGLHSVAAAHSFNYVISDMFPDNGQIKNVRICQAVVDGRRIFTVLTESRIVQILTWLLDCTLAIGTPELMAAEDDAGFQGFDSRRLDELDREIRHAWWAVTALQQDDIDRRKPRKSKTTF